MTESKTPRTDACEVPLVEQLRSVPIDGRQVIVDDEIGSSRNIPYGRMCHEAADVIDIAVGARVMAESELTAALAAKERAEAQLAEHKHSFDLRWQADQRARALWRKDRPDRDMIWPDHADLCVWLLEQRDALAAKLAEAEKDAARYRWLREQYEHTRLPLAAVVWKQNNDRQSSEWVNLVNGDALDAAIDAAISQERSDEH